MAELNVRKISKEMKAILKDEVSQIVSKGNRSPHLAAIMVGDNPASKAYVGNKVKVCDELGITSTLLHFDAEITQSKLIDTIHRLNEDDNVDGFILQLPLPAHLDAQALLMEIDPAKDVDGFHPTNFGKMALGLPAFLPATPYGIILLIEYLKLNLSGKKVAVLGRSDIVGTPISILLSRKAKYGNATVTLLHSRSKDIEKELQSADVIVAAIGIPHYVKADMVKEGVIIFDVGINRIEDQSSRTGSRLVGDVDFEAIKDKAEWITPVPGGIGLMTIVSLIKNTIQAYYNR
ncbi:MAG: bifunctional 5,10-methylenetetrahydrofolate dehydrogenase/5,10-methenyltetrahydrofolate cyclohydrolase [Bacteroidetes bacterium]|jgi:methylenetetrahydrofolate dehydrogenase (NADP+)/methenyltetrahydrofolate cyclohydrolase|nr:bifunctional 5,10-methylenetetrahydrofolate dehydrogenase/5,10-methenyltetrahydrofolate cyclohydrolase [Bacteroidota bacterium]MCB0604503.1 bifunctional 5,10-methylenetetrahydrofolate dehydrogenase/5,10-methenyltetrahydrofolate cyclohydrolase [Saprospiraceae bacterium]MCO5276507.1 bifunctional 5,10-methylenetetrahydrofolate dehydrogenase/5,10-methenyltetrahydrofolate cyclohydrolase [Saprospiraceae bacterium]